MEVPAGVNQADTPVLYFNQRKRLCRLPPGLQGVDEVSPMKSDHVAWFPAVEMIVEPTGHWPVFLHGRHHVIHRSAGIRYKDMIGSH